MTRAVPRALQTLLFLLALPFSAFAQGSASSSNIASTSLFISGSSLTVETTELEVGTEIPGEIQTAFGGLQNDQAPTNTGLFAVGELTGPAIETPIRLETVPGHKFKLPGLSKTGTYYLQNIRLERNGVYVQSAVPSLAKITVVDAFQTKVTVKQLTAQELRDRGIMVDARNFDVYEYSLSFFVGTELITIPFPVIIDKRTHEVIPIPSDNPYAIPGFKGPVRPPRWSPPSVRIFDFGEEGGDDSQNSPEGEPSVKRPSIPAAIVIPNNFGVLHQFFAVILQVENGASRGSSIVLDSISASMRQPAGLRVSETTPAVSFGQPVPVQGPGGVSFLVAEAKGEAQWVLESLRTGTHTFDLTVNATYKQTPASEGFPLRAHISEALVVHDPRFNITFSHPDTVRAGITYSTFSFITNMSPATQTIRVRPDLPNCDPNRLDGICRLEDDLREVPVCAPGLTGDRCKVARTDDEGWDEELTLRAGTMRTIRYRLKSAFTGSIFATAGSVEGDVIKPEVRLTMGVSQSGIALSPASLLMPYYAAFLDESYVNDNLQLLGLGYSLATAPVNQTTANFPRVIKPDVFQRAVDMSRAGQRIFLGEPKLNSFSNLTLDLLGNGPRNDLEEWDELRRIEYTGRVSGAALARQIENAGLVTANGFTTLLPQFGTATAHRSPYIVALTHGATSAAARPYAISFEGMTTGGTMDGVNEDADELDALGARLPWGDLSRVTSLDHAATGELAVIGLPKEPYTIRVKPQPGSSFTFELLLPGDTPATVRHAVFNIDNASGNLLALRTDVTGTSLVLTDSVSGTTYSATAAVILAEPLRIVGARQDMHLNEHGSMMTVLFNRPVTFPAGLDIRPLFKGKVHFEQTTAEERHVLYNGKRGVDSAALQGDGRTVNLTFDHNLSKNATYTLDVDPIFDTLFQQNVTFPQQTPVIDNDRSAGILYGHVLRADNSKISGAQVTVTSNNRTVQYDTSDETDGAYLFEYVLREINSQIYTGAYSIVAVAGGKSTGAEGAIRRPTIVDVVDLVFLGRGSATGVVRYNNGQPAKQAVVTAGSTMFGGSRQAETNDNGEYSLDDLPVGPLTFSVRDAEGNTAFAANQIARPDEVVHQDLTIFRQPFPGIGTVRGIVRRSDNGKPVAGASIAIYSQGYPIDSVAADANGRFEFRKVPAGLITVLGGDSIASDTIAVDFELAPDQVQDLTLTLTVRQDVALVTVTGTVEEEDPLAPGVFHRVPGALVQIKGTKGVTADANGEWVYPPIPVTFGGRDIKAYNPATKQTSTAKLVTLSAQTANTMSLFIRTADAYGTGTVRVRLLSAAGEQVSNYRILVPGFPPDVFSPLGGGAYELKGVPVGAPVVIVAVPTGASSDRFGEQVTQGSAKIFFDGQTVLTVLRLPGQGTVRVRLLTDTVDIGTVKMSYMVWDEAEQEMNPIERQASTNNNGVPGFATFLKVPVQDFTVWSALDLGYATASEKLIYDGQLRDIDLQARKLSTISGRIYSIDGVTPVSGVPVKMTDGVQVQGPQPSKIDGSYEFDNVAPGRAVEITTATTINGIYRVGIGEARSPYNGGPLRDVGVVLKKQGSIDGRIVYQDYKVFNPFDPTRNVRDDTPDVLTDNAPVPLAKFILRELSYPYRTFGTDREPMTADINGRYLLNNIFAGPVNVVAWAADNIDLLGRASTRIDLEGSTELLAAGIGAQGFGDIRVEVVDPNRFNAPVENAEITLTRSGGGIFDFGTTDPNGRLIFEQVPAGDYGVGAFSKATGNFGPAQAVHVVPFGGADVHISLQFSGSVSGLLVDPEKGNAPQPGLPVILSTSTYHLQTSSGSTPGDMGKYLFNGVREGFFTLRAVDERTQRFAYGQGTLDEANPNPTVRLELEPIYDLHIKVVLPADDGSPSNTPAPAASIEVVQRCHPFPGSRGPCDYERMLQQQGATVKFESVFEQADFSIGVRELGGSERTAGSGGHFPTGSSASNPLVITLPAYGGMRVLVRQLVNGVLTPAAGARVTVDGKVVSTDASGIAIITGLPLGQYWAGAVSPNELFSGYTTQRVNVNSQTTLAYGEIELGAYSGVSGKVYMENGQPSAGTRVLAQWPSRLAEMFTDSTGAYRFQGIAVAPEANATTAVKLTFFGADDTTVGAYANAVLTRNDASKVVPLSPVTLDATPPLLTGIEPPDNSTEIPADIHIELRFNEPLLTSSITPERLQLFATDGSGQAPVIIDPVYEGGQYLVRMIPTAPLKPNMLYRIVMGAGITDPIGNPVYPRGFSFITTDYVAPKVISVIPSTFDVILAQTRFELRFNKVIDTAAIDSGLTTGVLYRVDRPTAAGNILGAAVPGTFYPETDKRTVYFAPSEALRKESFYRLVVSGVRDLAGHVIDRDIVYHWTSFDENKPTVAFQPPIVPDTYPVVTGVGYTLKTLIRNENDGTPAGDVARVNFFLVEGDKITTLASLTKPPYEYTFVAPEATPTSTTITFEAEAEDRSHNLGPRHRESWTIAPNLQPQDVALVLTTPGPIYPGKTITLRPSFTDEGRLVTLEAQLIVRDGAGTILFEGTRGKIEATRAGPDKEWVYTPARDFTLTVPADLAAGSLATVTIKAADAVTQPVFGTPATFTLATDETAPTVLSVSSSAGTRLERGTVFTLSATVRDLESGVSSVRFVFDGHDTTVLLKDAKPGSEPGTLVFRTPSFTVPLRNEDTDIPVTVTATDQRGNNGPGSLTLTYVGVHDASAPRITWIAPVEGAGLPGGLPAGQTVRTKLRVHATDDIGVDRVELFLPGATTPILASQSANDIWEKDVDLDMGAAGSTVSIKATVHDANNDNGQSVTVNVTAVAVDKTIPADLTYAITSPNDVSLNKSLAVRGRLVLHIPATFTNLLVLEGGVVETLPSRPSLERRVDLTVKDILYVDSLSKIDVTGTGYAGGWQMDPDGTSEQNNDARGRTAGNVNTGGPTPGASASHAGVGGETGSGATNAVYGSFTSPDMLGTGGAGSSPGTIAGGQGGGSASIRGGTGDTDLARIVIGGAVLADGRPGHDGTSGAGSGGSVRIFGRTLTLGHTAVVMANGGNDRDNTTAGNSGSRGGGGGRVAMVASDSYVTDAAARIEARGGRNLGGDNAAIMVGAGAGTIYVKRPGQAGGELLVTDTVTSHLTRATIVGTLGHGTATGITANTLTDADATFSPYAAGERIVLATDPAKTFRVTEVSADGHTLTTDPADGDLAEAAGTGDGTYAGRIDLDAVTVGARGLARFDTLLAIGGAVDDRSKATIAAGGLLLFRDDVPAVTATTVPVTEGTVLRGGPLRVTAQATAPAGITALRYVYSASSSVEQQTFSNYATSEQSQKTLSTPPSATVGSTVTLVAEGVDRAGRVGRSTPFSYTIGENAPPVITRVVPTPAWSTRTAFSAWRWKAPTTSRSPK